MPKIRELLPVSAVSDHAKSLYDPETLRFGSEEKRYIPKRLSPCGCVRLGLDTKRLQVHATTLVVKSSSRALSSR